MRRLLFVLATIIAVLTFSCDTTQPEFDESVPDVFNITTEVVPEVSGTVTLNPQRDEYAEGSNVIIEAVPATGYIFERWEGGDLENRGNPATVTVTRELSITAFFTETEVPLTVLIEGQGTVLEEIIDQELEDVALTVTSKTNDSTGEESIDEETIKERDSVTLQPNRQTQTDLNNNRDDQLQTNDSDRPRNERPKPDQDENDAEVRQGPQQQESRASKQKAATTTIKLTAEPDEGWQFARWEGDLAGTQNPDTVVVEDETTITAVFEQADGASALEMVEQPTETTAGEFISPAPSVRLLNAQDQPVSGAAITASLNSGNFADVSETEAITNSEGIAEFDQLAVTRAGGNYRIEFDTEEFGISALTSSQFAATAAAGDPGNSSADVPDGIAGEQTDISVTVLDEFENPAINAAGNLSVSISGDNSSTPSVTEGDEAGEYIASYTPESAGEDEVSIELNGTPINGSPFTSSVTTTEVSTETSFAAISDAEVTVGEPVELTITVRDDQDNPLTGLESEIVISGLEDASAGDFSEGEPGIYTTEIASTVPADLSISITVSGVSLDQVLALTFLTGSAESIEIVSGDNQSASVTSELGEPLIVRVTDALENPVADASVTFSFDDIPSGTSGQSIDPETAETDENGEASARVRLGSAPGTYTVTATEADAGSVTFTAQADLGEASLISILNQPATITAGEALDPAPAVEITDSEENPVEGVEVNVALDDGSFASGSTLQVATNSAGIAAFDNLVITESGEDYTLTFEPGASSLDDITSDPFDVTAAAPEASNSTAEVPNGSAGDPTTITISLLDEFENPVAGSSELISIEVSSGPNNGATFTDVQDEGDGTYQTTYTPQTIGTDQITITVDGSEIEESPFTSSVVTTDAEQVEIISQPGDAVAGTVVPGTPSALVTDDNGNPVEDVEVTVSADGTSISGGTTTRITGSSGEVEFDDLVIEDAGSYSLQFDALGVSEAAVSEPFEISPADADQITSVGGDNQTGTVAQALANPFEVEVTDPFGNPVSGFEVEFSIDETPNGASGQSLNNESVTTNSSGRASSTLTLGDLVGEYTVAAGSAVGGVTFSAVAAPGDADSFVFDEISSQTAGSSFLVRITAFDEFENVATGYSGSADLTTTAGTISPGSVNFDEGEVSQSVSLTGAGTNQTITATDGSVSGTSNEFDVQTGGASDTEITQQPTNVTAGQALSPSPVVEVTDSQGNAVSGVDVEADLSSGSFASGAVSQTTDNNGLATFNDLSIETAGNFRILFDVLASGVEDPESSEFTVNAANPDPQNTDASVQNGAAGEETEIIITVEDEFENRVTGVESDLSVVVSGANEATPTVSENGNGEYLASYTPHHPESTRWTSRWMAHLFRIVLTRARYPPAISAAVNRLSAQILKRFRPAALPTLPCSFVMEMETVFPVFQIPISASV